MIVGASMLLEMVDSGTRLMLTILLVVSPSIGNHTLINRKVVVTTAFRVPVIELLLPQHKHLMFTITLTDLVSIVNYFMAHMYNLTLLVKIQLLVSIKSKQVESLFVTAKSTVCVKSSCF